MKHLPWKLLGAALALALVFDLLFYKTASVGINVLIMQIAILLASLGLVYHFKRTVSKGAWIAMGFALMFALTFAIWTSEIGTALSTLGIIVSNFYFALFLLGHHGKFHHPLHLIGDGVRYFAETYVTRLSIFGDFKIPAVSLRNSAILRGVLIAVPILIIFIALFLGSDLILQQRAEGLTDWLDDLFESGNIIKHVMLISSLTFVFLIFFAGVFWKRLQIAELKALVIKHNVESGIILFGVNILFFAFIIFQSVYLFGGQNAWNGIEGITYSEYAVQGFNELAAVTVLVVLLILSLRFFHTERSFKKIVHTAELILIVETLAIVFSAWKRMSLYVAQYDFTPARLFGFWFFILATVILLLLAYHIIKRVPQHKFMQQAPIVIGIAMLIFTISAPDALSVRMNIARAGGNDIDAFPLFNHLSAEAFPAMVGVLTSEEYQSRLKEPEEFCKYIEPDYASGRIVRILDTDDEYAVIRKQDSAARIGSNRFEVSWNNVYWKYDRNRNRNFDGKGDPQPKKIPREDWRTWNLSRVNVPRNADKTIPYELTVERPSSESLAAACGIPLDDPNYVDPRSQPIPNR